MKAPLQVFDEGTAWDWREESTAELGSTNEREARFRQLCDRELEIPFDLAAGPLGRSLLLLVEPDRHAFVVTVPAVVADPDSVDRLLSEIREDYDGGSPEEDPTQYVQFSEWQNEILAEDDVGDEGAVPWSTLDLEALARARLPFERLSGEASTAPCRHSVELDSGLLADLTRQPSRIEAVVLASWLGLLWYLAGRRDPLVGLSVDGRPYEDLDEVVGPLTKVMPFHCPLRPDYRWEELARKVGEVREALIEQQELFAPEGVLGAFVEGKGVSPWPFGFELEHDAGPVVANGVRFRVERRSGWIEPTVVKLHVVARPDTVELTLEHLPERISGEDVRWLAEQLLRTLTVAVRSPRSTLAELDLLSDQERRRLLDELNPTWPAGAARPTFLELFETAARQRASEVAVVAGGRQLTWEELATASARIAHRLGELGVGPETRVGLCAERTLEAIAGMLGVIRAGGAYVPLDPALPPGRLEWIAEEAGVETLITWGEHLEKLAGELPRVVHLDRDRQALEALPTDRPASGVRPEHLAYVLFTSGSTGRPKGVAIEHRQVASYLHGVLERLPSEVGMRWASVTTLAADLGLTMILPALATGGVLHLIDGETASDPEAFSTYMSEHRIDALKIVPGHLQVLLQGARPTAALPRKILVIGGEAAPPGLADRLASELSPECSLLNHYGPTEATIGVVTFDATDFTAWHTPGEPGAPPLGRPLIGSRVHVLGEHQRPVPIWVTGEIYLGGGNLARGYLASPGQTAERFMPDPFSRDRGERLYRTGDLGRYRRTGELEFIGRNDHQLKIRGFRAEPDEVAAVLNRHETVRDAVVIDDGGARDGAVRLVAYAVPAGRTDLDVDALRTFLGSYLPAYMIPAAFVPLEAIPRTVNGKLDRAALPTAEAALAARRRRWVAPRDEVEEVLAGIWEELLGVERVGAEDNFMELGGHSLLVTQLLSRLRRTFSIDLPMPAIFNAPTLADLAAAMREHETTPGHVAGVARVVRKLDAMSPDEVAAMLEEKRHATEGAR